MPDIMVRLFLFFFGYATCSLLHITLPQVSWLSTGLTTPEIFMDTNSALHFSYGYEPCRVPGPLFRYLRTSVPQFDVSANYFVNPRIQVRCVHGTTCPFLCLKSNVPTNYFKFDMSTTVKPPSSDYVNLARVTLHATSRTPGSKFDVSTTVKPPSSDYVNLARVTLHATSSQPRPNPSPILRTPGSKFDVSTTVEPPSSDYVNLARVTLHATSRPFQVRRVFDVSTLLRAPSSDYVSLTGVPLDATLRAPSKSDVSTTVKPPSSDYVGLTGIPLDATSW
ncbi:hypothetical protein EDD15DRAFT_2196047 [Pisolithus albus]|nr:hypothetical protein EDD15DRAFT_2196047 [Pisolithus albus]